MVVVDPIWDAFKKTGLRDPKTKRYPVQCNYCSKDLDGRIDTMYIHVIDHCKNISQTDKLKFIEIHAKKSTTSHAKSKNADDDQDLENTSLVSKKQKTSLASVATIDSYYTRPLSQEKIDLIHEALVKFFITCGISFCIIENKYFCDFLALLNINYFTPSKYKLIRDLISKIYSRILLKIIDSLKLCKDLTLIFDGWTTVSNSSVYAFLAVTSYGDIHVLGLEKFEDQCHTGENIADMAIETIQKIGLNMDQFSWVVTDSPNVMKKCRRIISERYPWIISLGCILHLINLICKGILSYPTAKEVIVKNNKLTTFFKTSHIWSKREAKQSKTGIDYEIIRIIEDRNYWRNNEAIMKILEPVNNTIKKLESTNTTLADAFLSIIYMGKDLISLFNDMNGYNDFKLHICQVYNKRFAELDLDLYFSLDEASLDDPNKYWSKIKNPKYAALIIFVKHIFALVPYAAEAERFFSILGYNNTKYRNHMQTCTLKIIGQIRAWLSQNESSEIQIKNSKQDNEINAEDLQEIYDIEDWDNGDILTSTELENELETFFEKERAENETIVNSVPEFMIEQLIDINDPFFCNQNISNNFIDESLVIEENSDSDWDINTVMES
ncbi:zinc finger bed domain-containing protein 1-like [Gigaspora margarita]|uniref:Zinc finger bed domain-containing protein 1-like n=1 Tax=Gigaspora margarita TaxID=4874 RepID=A0A8H4ADZ6_GIGMA|nr:zinc finger bed domain-containing protein 1-like [Gigaspora margarita]